MPPVLYSPNIGSPAYDQIIDLKSLDLSNGLLIRSTNWLGDAVMTLPALYKIRQSFPKLKIIVLCQKKLSAFWECVDWIDEIIAFAGKRLKGETAKKLKALAPSACLILPNSFGSIWDMYRLGMKNRIACSGRGRTMLVNHKLPVWKRVAGQDELHQLNHYLSIVKAIGIDKWDGNFPPLSVNLEQSRIEEIMPNSSSVDYLILAPAAAYGKAKQWPIEHYRVMADYWSERGQCIVIGAPGEESIAESVASGIKNTISLAGKTNLKELVFLLKESRLVIANDSGTMHLAAALQKDGVAIFGSTEEIATGPIGGRWIIHRKRLACSPCLQRECPREDFPYECLVTIKPDDVIKSVEYLLNES